MYLNGDDYENKTWQDGMDFEAVVHHGLEEDDDLNEGDAAFMRGFLGESNNRFEAFGKKPMPEAEFVRMQTETFDGGTIY